MNTPIVRSPEGIRTSKPPLATAAPAIPPTRAWDELVGRPRKNVIRFQPMAPMSPAKTTPIESTSGSTTPVAIVAATNVPKTRKAMKLNTAAHTTAMRGDSTRVETTVAIELAASWNPLTKSKASAIAMTTTRATVSIGAQACFRTMPSITSEASSSASRAFSNASTTSFQYSVAEALSSPEYSRASARR